MSVYRPKTKHPEDDILKTNIFDGVSDNKSCTPTMMGGSVKEYINRDIREVSVKINPKVNRCT